MSSLKISKSTNWSKILKKLVDLILCHKFFIILDLRTFECFIRALDFSFCPFSVFFLLPRFLCAISLFTIRVFNLNSFNHSDRFFMSNFCNNCASNQKIMERVTARNFKFQTVGYINCNYYEIYHKTLY